MSKYIRRLHFSIDLTLLRKKIPNMRKLKLQMNITTDGFVAGPKGELDWLSSPIDGPQLKLLNEITESMDTIIMGRGMVDEFTTYWEDVVSNQPESPEYQYAKIFVDTPKIVFSETVTRVKGKNTTVESSGLVQAVNTLKSERGKDIIVYGGANFVSNLLKNRLIDDLYLFVHPIAIGEGLRIFRDRVSLKLVHSDSFPDGVIANHYQQLP